MTTKKDIRKHFLEKRLNLDDATSLTLNERLLANCRQLDYGRFRLAHIFLPISEKKEVDTWPLVKWMREQQPQIAWVLSRSDMKTGEMTHHLWKTNTILVKNKFGIPEPDQGEIVQPEDIDLVFVPLLAFDRDGQRIGYGKGMYDRFLQQCSPQVRTIGLSLFEPVQKIEDTDPWDIPLQTVVTPDHIYQFK
ncbi:5-formyltetrahydrofolate cyclo-ligase [Chitinophaga sp. 22321]|uniref:5-formyltetrahydrofolate cyclo-ligase n=1 Tax=Chitinophaga hostae TaxID=2831022 RepID=A0ABS5J9Q4_9BACT|nr:5-formyltetrahydrofolate cyclo-ligase [Chitinophaga hostae]MBS0031931.1 5-formyltetrahydrofolate cyclo-ligase [Chitinophaga hostae]